jgi:hypothetical protein
MANTDSADVGEDKVERKAKHGLLSYGGEETRKFEEAGAITYALIGRPDDVFTFDVPESIPHGHRMLALFGARTLATNTASQIRQKGGDEAEQMEAVRDRFADLMDGTWVERAERVGAKIDVNVLAGVYATWATTQDGKPRNAVEIAARLESDTALRRKVYGIPDVKAEYVRQAGKPVDTKAVTDLL